MRKIVYKTRKELFVDILKKWRDDEEQIIAEWGIKNKEQQRQYLVDEYNEYLRLWNVLEEDDLK